MTISQIEAKIQELETWLIDNPHNPQRNLIESDLKNLKTLLEQKNYE
ncbi:hypothetical protein OIU80_05505 [Flavobacterium sp. LS1R47]|jgi:hypothetical protein|uniref:Uncharacterized protein n=1 Tax=Flavobacterium frigoritolerans TaxID=2987686 RepID=A0A9X2ZL26_9FLAO|nr:hypothetical protein [Flavobacterium frigoritolerans]MCV9931732.1 hypothetical protein [Flavobacterium frigoritolerans]